MTDTDMAIEYRDTASLTPYAKNSRTHSDAQVAQIVASIREFGFRNPVLIDEHDGLIAGHGRVLAAKVLDLPRLPCIVVRGLTDAQRRAFVIADNKIATNASWNADLLRVELADLKFAAFDVALLGFSEQELSLLDGNAVIPHSKPVTDEQRHTLLVEFPDEPSLQRVFDEMQERGLNVKVMS